MKQKLAPGQKIICHNRKAKFNYFFIELIEAGIVLKGSEVKSLRDGKGNIADSYAIDNNGELYLINSHIPLYRQSSYNNHDPKSDRKLLLNRKEINKLIGRINQDGLTLVPTKLYFLKGKVKVEIAVAKGKKLYDKRQVKKTRDWNREKARLLSKNNK
jgi:SsrA-binding protein